MLICLKKKIIIKEKEKKKSFPKSGRQNEVNLKHCLVTMATDAFTQAYSVPNLL